MDAFDTEEDSDTPIETQKAESIKIPNLLGATAAATNGISAVPHTANDKAFASGTTPQCFLKVREDFVVVSTHATGAAACSAMSSTADDVIFIERKNGIEERTKNAQLVDISVSQPGEHYTPPPKLLKHTHSEIEMLYTVKFPSDDEDAILEGGSVDEVNSVKSPRASSPMPHIEQGKDVDQGTAFPSDDGHLQHDVSNDVIYLGSVHADDSSDDDCVSVASTDEESSDDDDDESGVSSDGADMLDGPPQGHDCTGMCQECTKRLHGTIRFLTRRVATLEHALDAARAAGAAKVLPAVSLSAVTDVTSVPLPTVEEISQD